MNKENVETFDLNLKLIFFILILCIFTVCIAVYSIFFAPLDEQLKYQGTMLMATQSPAPIGGGIILVPYIIYLIILVIYKRKNVLTISENKIEYYNIRKGKIVIEKNNIIDVFVSKNLVIKYVDNNQQKLHNINLTYIKCDKKILRNAIIRLKRENDIVKKIISSILEEYHIKSLSQLKDNNEALKACIIKLYNMNKLTQQEIGIVLDTNSTKVSKIIRKYINTNNIIN